MSEQSVVERSSAPATVDSLAADLRAIGVIPGMTVLVHSSLSALGWVSGGAVAVILALEQASAPDGTIVMPAHSGDLSDPALWVAPPVPSDWWETIRATMPAFSVGLTPTRGMGAIAETFRKQEGVLRSSHPQVSFAARGPRASSIIRGHVLDRGLGEYSPLARLYELDAWVLLLGVTHARNTSVHLAEYRAEWPGKRFTTAGAPVMVDGIREWVTYQELDLDSSDFDALGLDFEQKTEEVRIGRVGAGTGRLMRQRSLVDFAVPWIECHR